MILSKEFINKVKQSVDLLELASRYTELKKVSPNVYAGICPNPNHHDNNPSFTVFTNTQSWCCYGCHYGEKILGKTHEDTNYGSDCFAFIQWISEGEISWYQAVIKLAKENGIPIPSDKNEKLYREYNNLTNAYCVNMKPKVRKYLYNRGLDDQDIIKWKIGYDGIKITFPLLNKYDQPIGFTKRWIIEPEWCRDKYRNSSTSDIFNKSSYFYGVSQYNVKEDYIYITEGVMDVILAHKYGLKNVVATLGTSFTDTHAEIIKAINKTPIFIMDSDEAGIKAMHKAILKMERLNVQSYLVILPKNLDLADYANLKKDSLVESIKQLKMSYGYYCIQNICHQYESQLLNLQLSFAPEIKEALKNVPQQELLIIKSYLHDKMHLTLQEDILNERNV